MMIPAGQKPFQRGQLVEVRGEAEIRAMLDADGKYDGVPFMPEMARYCGRRIRVARRADKTCVEGHGVRSMRAAVFLEELRCDGSGHDGCQRNCMLFWKEAWLKLVDSRVATEMESSDQRRETSETFTPLRTRSSDRYFCQSTELYAATSPLPRWNLAHFVGDFFNGELSPWRFVQIFSRMAVNRFRTLLGLRKIGGLAGSRAKNPKGNLNLQSGERVEICSTHEIESTLDPDGRNAGLTFEPDMLEYCGRQFEVDFPVQKIILERTGKMATLTSTVALKGVTCQGLCAKNCPRSNPLYWRESWLRRVNGD